MTKTQSNPPFEIVITKDGSPSLAFFKDGFSQMMHSSKGAFSETEFVYGKALDLAFEHFDSVQALSVGLGFSYVELTAVARKKSKDLEMISYEKEPRLRIAWTQFINGAPSEFSEVYEKILSMYCEHHKLEKEVFVDFFKSSKFQLKEALDINTPINSTFNCILFDPFCSKFSPEFWTENGLTDFLQSISSDQCVFATYAATGALSRSLKSAGFKKIKNKGFAGKREFTLAIKNL
ncbi:MAG: hypothetical protein KDD37_00650 [Bdellovibrionales bacterium]|nr:hypothetical protein [Bdellovibrionales bacterium]